MKYHGPLNDPNPDASYVNKTAGVDGSVVGAQAIEPPLREIVAAIIAAGLTPSDDDLTQLSQAIRILGGYVPCSVWYPVALLEASPGMVPGNGTLIGQADERYPLAWAFLQTGLGQQLCITQEEYDAAIADDAGGNICAKFVLDAVYSTLRVPDIRGAVPTAAGADDLAQGLPQGDATRNLTGTIGGFPANTYVGGSSGVFSTTSSGAFPHSSNSGSDPVSYVSMDISAIVPVAQVNRPKRWGVEWCVWLGVPQEV